MCKKFLTVGILGAIAAVGVATTGAWSYVKTGYKSASQSVRDSVPLEWELKRARGMIEDLKPEIKKNLQIVMREEVGVQQLATEIDKKETMLADSQSKILRLKEDLESGSVHFVYAGNRYSKDQVRDDLNNRFKSFKVNEATTGKLSQVLAAREKNLSAARRKLDEMLNAKRELEVEVENLQARMTLVEVAKASNPVALDDSHLSDTKQLLQDIRTRIDVAERMVGSEGAFGGSIPLEEEASPELLDEIAEYFGEQDKAEIEVLLSDNSL
ncbi:MAG: hypothetical protein AB8B50_13555 [Pirellulaceae bacterium]